MCAFRLAAEPRRVVAFIHLVVPTENTSVLLLSFNSENIFREGVAHQGSWPHVYSVVISPVRRATAAASVLDCTCSFLRILETWRDAVLGEMNRRVAICWLVRPSAT